MEDDFLRLQALAGAIYQMRRTREGILGEHLFSDPSWDILLFLFESHGKQEPPGVTTVCNNAVTSSTTALRWIGYLEQSGQITRSNHETDGRKVRLTLTDQGLAQMTEVLILARSALRKMRPSD